MAKEININKFLKNFAEGKYDNLDVNGAVKAGWYDWFCKDESLPNKTKKLARRLKAISKSDKFDNETSYVFFKNNCPCSGPLYDDFRICSIETGDVIYTVTPKSGHTGLAEVYGKENDFKEALIEGAWKDVKNWFLGKDEVVNDTSKAPDYSAEYKALRAERKELQAALPKLKEEAENAYNNQEAAFDKASENIAEELRSLIPEDIKIKCSLCTDGGQLKVYVDGGFWKDSDKVYWNDITVYTPKYYSYRENPSYELGWFSTTLNYGDDDRKIADYLTVLGIIAQALKVENSPIAAAIEEQYKIAKSAKVNSWTEYRRASDRIANINKEIYRLRIKEKIYVGSVLEAEPRKKYSWSDEVDYANYIISFTSSGRTKESVTFNTAEIIGQTKSGKRTDIKFTRKYKDHDDYVRTIRISSDSVPSIVKLCKI